MNRHLVYIFIPVLMLLSIKGLSQNDNRLDNIRAQLIELSSTNQGLNQTFETEINISNVNLQTLLMGIAELYDININIDQSITGQSVTNTFKGVNIIDLFVFLCKEYELNIEFTGNILSFKPYSVEEVKPEDPFYIEVFENDMISMDIKNQKLSDVVKEISKKSGRNIVFKPGLENKNISIFTTKANFKNALLQLAIGNALNLDYSENDFIVFTKSENTDEFRVGQSIRTKVGYEIIDEYAQLLKVSFRDTSVKDIINSLTVDLNLNVFTATPLDEAGKVTFVASEITLDQLLHKIFEKKNTSSQASETNGQAGFNSNKPQAESSRTTSAFTFKKENNIYYFGTESQLSIQKVELIRLKHRSVEMLSDPSGGMTNRRNGTRNLDIGAQAAFRSFGTNNFRNNPTFSNANQGQNMSNRMGNTALNNNPNNGFQQHSGSILDLVPEDLVNAEDLNISLDYEQNSLYVSGSSQKIERLKNFLQKIDKPVPVVLIEVMIIEVSRSAIMEAGISWGIGNQPTSTQGNIFPQTNLNLGAETINRVIGGFDGFGSFNLGKVVPNFFASIKAMEENGKLKVRSTPKLSTLSGHRATFSNGQTSYYTVTEQNIFSGNNPINSTIQNFVPIDAELGLTIKPIVSGDGQVTLDIFVIQSDFGQRISENAPPDIRSREFSSLIRVRDQDIVVLGGLEEQKNDDSGNGVPFLARVPVIKWLFSQRRREDSKSKLTILIKPTIIE